MAAPQPTVPQPADVLRRMFDDSMAMLDPWVAAWSAATAAPAGRPARPQEHGPGHHEHGSHEHGSHAHSCHEHGCHERGCHAHGCGCGAADADLVLVARVGERRIVPLSLHNSWRRERPVTVGVSAFRSCDPCAPDVAIEVVTEPRGEIVLPPCSHTVIDVIVSLPRGKREAADIKREAADIKREAADIKREAAEVKGELTEVTRERRVGRREDADCCCSVTLVGDISTDGCARPVRLAVVVLPRDCDAHEIDCCGCCSC